MPTYRSFAQHLDPKITPKRILALDGGGIRGVLTVGMLREIETLLRARFGDPKLCLADYFDLIGGTSTGSIIAAGLALGMSVDEIHAHYLRLGDAVFKRSLLRPGIVRAKFDAAPVSRALKSVFGERTLASPDFKTGLMVMAKRYDTGSPWPLSNNPRAKYFGLRENSRTIPNGEFPLWRVVRASTAAPHYFDPETIEISRADPARSLKAVSGEFVDGGVSTANNPALQLVLTATVEGCNFGWQTGADKLLVVSVGTGRKDPALGIPSGLKATAAARALASLASLMDDCGELVETVMQWLSVSPTARDIDREILKAAPPLSGGALLSYVRYNVFFEKPWAQTHLGVQWSDEKIAALALMDEPKNMPDLDEVGRLAGRRLVKPEHFIPAFDKNVVS
jgi:predicted acylesterase/phospholipase RssA